MSDQNEGGSSSSSSSAKEIAATVGVGVVQTAMFIYDFLTFPIYYAAQRPWKAVEAGARIRADIVARLGFGPEIFPISVSFKMPRRINPSNQSKSAHSRRFQLRERVDPATPLQDLRRARAVQSCRHRHHGQVLEGETKREFLYVNI